MASLQRDVVGFVLNNNVGRGFLGLVAVAFFVTTLRCVLLLLPGGLATTIWNSFLVGTFGIIVAYYVSLRGFGRVRHYIGTAKDLKRVYERMPTAHRAPQPPIWAYGGHIQFIPWIIYNIIAVVNSPLAYERDLVLVTGLEDKTKDESETNTRSVADHIVLSFFPPTKPLASGDLALPLDAPTIIVEPGLTCTSQDVPGSSFLRLSVARGFRVIVIERRGHAQPLTKPRWNLFGDSDDFEQMYNRIKDKLPDAPLFWCGFSSGTKLPIEAVGKFDERRKNGDKSAPTFVATASVCPGYNLETCFLGFGFPYKYMCLSSVKSKFLMQNEAVLRSYNSEAYDKAIQADNLQTLLCEAAPFAGYPSSQEYFAAENPVLYAPLITTPTLIINSLDDPCTVARNAYGTMPGQSDKDLTFVKMVEQSPVGLLLMSPSGSHCPFLDGGFWPFVRAPKALGGLVIKSWADSCILEFFEGYLLEHRSNKFSDSGASNGAH